MTKKDEAPKQPFTSEQLTAAIAAGLALSSPESEQLLPVKLAAGVLILHQLMLAMGTGQIGIIPVKPKEDPKKPNPPGKPPGTPNSKKKAKPKKRIRAIKKK